MKAAGGGCIFNTASGSCLLADVSRVAYGTSKAAVISLTRYIATQHGKDRIRCNALATGPIVTPHTRGVAGPLFYMIARHKPIRDMGTHAHAASLLAFFAAVHTRPTYVNTIVP